MNPLPISHFLSVDPSMGCDVCGSGLGNAGNAVLSTTQTYSHGVQVLFELPGNLVCELTAHHWTTALVPFLCRNLPSQSTRDNTTRISIPT